MLTKYIGSRSKSSRAGLSLASSSHSPTAVATARLAMSEWVDSKSSLARRKDWLTGSRRSRKSPGYRHFRYGLMAMRRKHQVMNGMTRMVKTLRTMIVMNIMENPKSTTSLKAKMTRQKWTKTLAESSKTRLPRSMPS